MLKERKRLIKMSSPGLWQVSLISTVITLVVVVVGHVGSGSATEDADLLEQNIRACELGVKFFREDFSAINLDGLFGIRLGQGQIISANEECLSSKTCPKEIRRRLQAMIDEIDQIARKAQDYVKDKDEKYFGKFIQTVDSPYLLDYKSRMLTDLRRYPVGISEQYNESKGDNCFARLMGTYQDERRGKQAEKCVVTDDCWDLFTKNDRKRYAITHELLYFIFLEKNGCLEKAKRFGKSIAEIQQNFCGSIYNEAVLLSKGNKVTSSKQDLFLEQTLLCGVIGIENFFRRDWIKMVGRWQSANGCFSVVGEVKEELEEQDRLEMDKAGLLLDLQTEDKMIKEYIHHGRKLLREEIMPDGCLSHKSGLGFGTLCLYVRFLIRVNFLQDGI